MRPRVTPNDNRDIPMAAPSTIQKRKERAEAIKAARDKYSNLSRSKLPPSTSTVPLDRPTTSRLRPPSASALPPPSFQSDPSAAAAIRAPLPSTAMTGRSSTLGRPSVAPRPSLAPRPSIAPRPSVAPSIVARPLARPSVPRPSMLPRDAVDPFVGLPFGSNFNLSSSSSSSVIRPSSSNSSIPFEPMGDSLSRIMRNEPLPMASGARASSIARRAPRPSMMPGAINIFTATGSDRLEAERLLGTMTPRLRQTGGDESVARSRVRFEMVESIQEQRESVGDEVDGEPTSSAAIIEPSARTTQQSTVRRDPPSLLPSLPSITRPLLPLSVDPPRSILKQKKSPRGAASASSSTTIVSASSSNTLLGSSNIDATETRDENQLTRDTPSRGRLTPAKNGSSKKKKKHQGMMDVFAILNRMTEEETRDTPHEMIKACMDMLKKMDEQKIEEKRQEEEDTEDEEEAAMNRGILEENEEEDDPFHETIPLQPLEVTIDGTPRRRSSRLASSQGNNIRSARSLFSD